MCVGKHDNALARRIYTVDRWRLQFGWQCAGIRGNTALRHGEGKHL